MDQRNRGVMFTNDRKKPGSNDPDLNGRCSAVCPKCGLEMGHFIAGWITRAKSGLMYWKLQFQPKVEAKRMGRTVDIEQEGGDFSDIPKGTSFPWER